MKNFTHVRFLVPLFALALATIARAAQPEVTAVLTESETVVGRPVTLQIQITGASHPKPPGEINVDGLEIRSAGVSQQYQMQNFSVSYSFTYNYTVTPLQAGTFTIPELNVEAGGHAFRTPPLTLNVVNGSSQSAPSARPSRRDGRSDSAIDPSQIGFLELILPKSSAYVGEVIPAQVRLGLNVRAPVQSLGDGIQIAGQGFTTQKMNQPRQAVETINGRTYQVFIFNTAISAVRAGTLEIGPVEATPTVRVARAGQHNPSLPRDLFDDPIFNSFFNDPAFAPSVPRDVPLKSKPATLEIKPLPPHAPADFSGAVGSFTMKSDASPKTAQIGDPITITTEITGRGNFDRVTAPKLENEAGWHTYPPSNKFKQDDDVGISGTKTFDSVVSAKEVKNKLPPVVFSFFDPVKESYVTLKSDELPLQIEGGTESAATPAVAGAASPNATPAAPPTPPKEQDILYQMTERPAASESFVPLYERQLFWLLQLIPAVALLGFAALKWRSRRRNDREAQRLARWQHEVSDLHRKLRRDGATPQEYVADASRAVQLKTALVRKVNPNVVDAEVAAAAFRLDEDRSTRLRQLFEESDELRYSGAVNGHGALSPEKRREILELVENLHA